MSANHPHSLTDENPDLRKQIGCMTGLFLLFDRRRSLIRSNNHKGPSPGQSGNNGEERNNIIQTVVEKNLENCDKEKRRVSDESSTISFSSSSCSSTLSLVDCSKTPQPEPSSLEHSIFSRNPSQIPPTNDPNSSSHLGKHSLDLRIVVKDSIGTTKAKGVSRVVRNVDSPRPPKDAPRFSYDERASRDKWKSATKLKELPRLSLDSRERYIRKTANGSNYLLDNLEHGNCISSQTLDPQQEPGSNKRSTSVVVKLMGLEAFPDSNGHIREIKCCMDDNLDTTPTSSRKANESTYNKASRSPKSQFPLQPAPWRQPERNRDSQIITQNKSASVYGEIEKMVTELEFERCGKELRALKQILEAMGKTEERLENGKEDHASNLEPQTNNHGLNYLNRHKITPIRKTGQPKKFESSLAIIKTAKVVQKRRYSCSSVIPMESVSGLHKLRTKDRVDIRKDSIDNRKAKDLPPRKNHFIEPSSLIANSMDKITNFKTLKSIQTTKSPQHRNGGNPDRSASSSTIVSPRLQQKKQTRPATPTSDSSRTRGHLSYLQIASSSPGRKFKPKSPNLQQGDEKLSETRDLSHHGDAISEQSDSNLSWASQSDIEVTSTERSKESNQSYQHKDQKHGITARSSKDRSNCEATTATFEQPSPVSVLDTTFYGEEPPSPVKKISNAFTDEETLNSDEAEWSLVDLNCSPNITRPNLSHQFDQEKFESIKYLVQKLRQVNSKHDEVSTDHIASLCETTKPQHRYITEILIASGILLKDLGSSSTIIQLHQSSHLINPNLFLVLEQTKGRIDQSKFSEKIQRKLIFDVVNEILFRILTSEGFYDPWISAKKIGLKSLSGRKLLKELCSEMDHLQANSECSSGDEDDSLISILREDMMHHTKNWADYNMEVPGVVLDIERLIFKDLIGDIVSSEAARLQSWPTKNCRQLFLM